VLRRDKITFD